MTERLPDWRLDPPEDRDTEARIEAAERDGERRFDAWYEAGYPEEEI